MKLNKIQNRRDFLRDSVKKGLKFMGGISGIIIGNQNLVSGIDNDCPFNIPCSDCYKMGICDKEAAEKARHEVKRDSKIVKISKGASNV